MPVFPSMTDVNLIKVLQMLLDAPEVDLSNFYLENWPLSHPTSPSLSPAGSPAEISAASHTGKDLKRAATDGGSNTLARKVLDMLPGQMGNLARADDAVIQVSKVFDLPDPGPPLSSLDRLQLLFDHSDLHSHHHFALGLLLRCDQKNSTQDLKICSHADSLHNPLCALFLSDFPGLCFSTILSLFPNPVSLLLMGRILCLFSVGFSVSVFSLLDSPLFEFQLI